MLIPGNQIPSNQAAVLVGCAGWSTVSRLEAAQPKMPQSETVRAARGSALERYARVLGASEINSSFYRPHRPSTYQKWAQSVPRDFRFSVKVPKAVTHQHKLRGCEALLGDFAAQTSGLGDKLGCYLLQLPPSLAFDAALLDEFLALLRSQVTAAVVCEPRHRSWFEGASAEQAAAALRRYQVGRVAADPALCPAAAQPGGELTCVYYRWHGSPSMYYSAYSLPTLQALAGELSAQQAAQRWVIFDNTASRAGIENALVLQQLLIGG